MSIEGKHAYRFVFLKSDKWQSVRLEALVREGGQCEICGEESISNDAHHVMYPDSFWETEARHLVILCRPCHTLVHAIIGMHKKTDGECIEEWKKIIRAIHYWNGERKEWMLKINSASLATPKSLREAYASQRDHLKDVTHELEICKAMLAEYQLKDAVDFSI